jgi:transposase
LDHLPLEYPASSVGGLAGIVGLPLIVDRLSGKTRPAQIFVAVLGASDWIGAHIQALVAIGSVPQLLVPDTTKVAVIKACLYEAAIRGAIFRE